MKSPFGPAAVKHRGAILWAMLLSTVAVTASTSCAIPAIPEIGRGLDATQAELQWVVDITPVVLAALLLPSGALVDRFGRRRALLYGHVILGVGLVWSGLANSPEELIGARFVTGLGGAAVLPATLSTITTVFVGAERDRPVALWAVAMVLGGAIGFVVAGVSVERMGWGALFLSVAALVAVALVIVALVTPETRAPDPPRLDILGALLSLAAIGTLVLAVIEAPVAGAADPLVVSTFLIGCALTVCFVFWELRTPSPMLDVRLFADKAVAAGAIGLFISYIGAAGWYFLAFQYNAYVLGYGPLKASLGLLPIALTMVPAALLATPLVRRFGWRATVAATLGACAAALVVMAAVGDSRAFIPVALGSILFGAGLGATQPPVTQAIVDGLPPEKQGVASALNDTTRELGHSFGIAIFGSVFNAAYRSSVGDQLTGTAAGVVETVRDSPAVALALAERTPADHGLTDVVATGAVAGWEAALLAGAGILLAGAIYIAVRGPVRPGAPRRPAPRSSQAPAVAQTDGTPLVPGRSTRSAPPPGTHR